MNLVQSQKTAPLATHLIALVAVAGIAGVIGKFSPGATFMLCLGAWVATAFPMIVRIPPILRRDVYLMLAYGHTAGISAIVMQGGIEAMFSYVMGTGLTLVVIFVGLSLIIAAHKALSRSG